MASSRVLIREHVGRDHGGSGLARSPLTHEEFVTCTVESCALSHVSLSAVLVALTFLSLARDRSHVTLSAVLVAPTIAPLA